MALVVTQTNVETMSVEALVVTGELHSITAMLASELFGRAHQLFANSLATPIGSNVDRLHLRSAATHVLKVSKSKDLADPNDLAVIVGH